MNRRDLLKRAATIGVVAAVPGSFSIFKRLPRAAAASPARGMSNLGPVAAPFAAPIARPGDGSAIPVAFLVSDGAVMIDFAGPWEVFTNVMPGGRMDVPTFKLYTVSETAKPITASGGMKIIPDYTLANAPAPRVVVIPAQNNDSKPVLEWIRGTARTADLVMSVCTGAFVLAETGLLSGKSATTHHGAYTTLEEKYPDIHVKRGVRFVDDGNIATSGGLSCGIDLALHVVERYYDRETAKQAAFNMEYQGQGWIHPDANTEYASMGALLEGHSACVVCAMTVDPATALSESYKNKTYYFCSPDHKAEFDSNPERVLSSL
jgi:putative intracellular protease/amidase/YHS domain-containing protein